MRHLYWAVGFALFALAGVILNVILDDLWWAAGSAFAGLLCVAVVYCGWRYEQRTKRRWRQYQR